MTSGLDLALLRQWIGREETAEELLTPAVAERFHATLGLTGEPAATGEVAPPLLHFCLCQTVVETGALGADGHPRRGAFLPPVPLPRRMWAGGAITFAGDLRVGDVVRRHSRITDVTAKSGRSGTLCFVTVEHDIGTNGSVVVRERQDIVYRDPPSGAPAAAPDASSPTGRTVELVEASPALLFRYSALTFNAHRIHYDLPYATGEEGYPGLVVQGPLQATLLLHHAIRCHGGKTPDTFAFRGLAPAIAGLPLELHAGEARDGRLELWTAQPGRSTAMQATAEWR